MKRSGSRWAWALLVAVSLGCGGDAVETVPADAPAPTAGADLGLADGDDWLEAEDPGTSAPELVSVRLTPDPPVPGEVIRAVARVEGGEGGYDLEYVWDVAGRRIEDETGGITLPSLRRGERIEVAVTARNAAGSSETLVASTEIENAPPMVLDLQVQEKYDDEGGLEGWEARAWARDPDGDDVEIRYTWYLNDRPTDVDAALFPVDQLERGDRVWVQAVASDGDEESEVAQSGVLEVGNTAPEIVSTPPQIDDSGLFSYALEVTDADGDRSFRYELVEGPRGMRIDAFRGKLTWRPEESQAGRHRVEVAVDDRNGGRSTQAFVIPVVVRRDGAAAETPPANTP